LGSRSGSIVTLDMVGRRKRREEKEFHGAAGDGLEIL
jgi:hypothetical protein